jgi:DeoR/GlpR family transcriptional regulator of sugar metabolism
LLRNFGRSESFACWRPKPREAQTVKDLARALGVSEITIKRDLASLRRRGHVIRMKSR